MERKIKSYTYYSSPPSHLDIKAECKHVVGENGVTEIIENRARGKNDLWNYEIHYETGIMIRHFQPVEVLFDKSKITSNH